MFSTGEAGILDTILHFGDIGVCKCVGPFAADIYDQVVPLHILGDMAGIDLIIVCDDAVYQPGGILILSRQIYAGQEQR